MAIWNRKEDSSSTESQTKNEYSENHVVAEPEGVIDDDDEKGVALHRGLKARHITMIGMFSFCSACDYLYLLYCT